MGTVTAEPQPRMRNLAADLMVYWGICFCSPSCARGLSAAHGWLYHVYSAACYTLAGLLTLASFITLCFDSASFQELTDGFINFCSLYTTWMYIRVWRTRAGDVHQMLTEHYRFLADFWRQADSKQRHLVRQMLRADTMFVVYVFGALSGVIVAVELQAVVTLVPALPPVPRDVYEPPAPGETDPLGASRLLRFSIITVLQALALPCCGMPFAGLSAIQFGINMHAIFLLRCLKRALHNLSASGNYDGKFGQRSSLNVIIGQHQHIVKVIHMNNDIFAGVMMQRLVITYALLGLTAYCVSKDPFGDVKIPIIALFMIFSLLQFSVLSDILKYKSSCVGDWVWECNWLEDSDRRNWYKLCVVMARAQQSDRDGLAAVGMQERISMVTFVQVMRSSVSFLQALRNLKTT